MTALGPCGAPIRDVHPDEPTGTDRDAADDYPPDDDPDPVPLRRWDDPLPWDQLIKIAPVSQDDVPALDGARVVCVGDDWLAVDRPTGFYAPGTTWAHVVGVTGDAVTLELPDMVETIVHRSTVAPVTRVDADGVPTIVLGAVDEAPEPEADDEPEEVPPDPPAGGSLTCPDSIVAFLRANQGVEFHLDEIKRACNQFQPRTIEVTISQLVSKARIVRVRPGYYRAA